MTDAGFIEIGQPDVGAKKGHVLQGGGEASLPRRGITKKRNSGVFIAALSNAAVHAR